MSLKPRMTRIALSGFMLIALVLFSLLRAPAARADDAPDAEIRALYERFAAAQNARTLDAVRPLFTDSPRFLWVSDGMSFWGRDAVLERMAAFQTYEIWRVEPELARASIVSMSPDVAYLHLPLSLTLGARDPGPDRFGFLVSVLCVRTDQGWRIAALFTTRAKDG